MSRYYKTVSIFFLIILGIFSCAEGQTRTSFETSTIISNSNTTPFWFQANRSGIYSRGGNQFLTRLQAHRKSELSDRFDILYGADLIARPGRNSTLSFNQGYFKAHVFGLEFAAGRFHNISPISNADLSLGSLGISGNATPIPQLKIGLNKWQPLPFFDNFVEISGHISHGWLGSRRYTEDVLLHEKVFHAKFGGDGSFNMYGGLAHYAKWGGNNHPSGRDVPTRFRDFFAVFFSLEGDEDTPGPEQAHALGDHLGAWDFGFQLELNDYEIHAYRQFPYEDYSNLFFKSYMDALTGISVQIPDYVKFPANQILYEFLYTKFQAGPREARENPDDGQGPYRYNENYYNHYFYRTGWVYQMRTIGNPLFTPSPENLGILNNRIIAHHIGIISAFSQSKLTGKATFSRNYGKRCDNRVPDIGEGELFGIECINEVETVRERSIDQWSFYLGIDTPVPFLSRNDFIVRIQVAYDNGRLAGDQVGTLFGIKWIP